MRRELVSAGLSLIEVAGIGWSINLAWNHSYWSIPVVVISVFLIYADGYAHWSVK